MTKNLKVKILKKSKNAPYPEHIIVERQTTNEMVHLYFDNGNLAKLTYIVRNAQNEPSQNSELPSYTVKQETVYKTDENGQKKTICVKGPESQNFFEFLDSFTGESSSIAFKSSPDKYTDFYVEMDSADRCIPHGYLADCGVADVKEIYPHQKRKIHPSSELIAKGIMKSR